MRSILLLTFACGTTPTNFTDGGDAIPAAAGEQHLFSFDDDAEGALPDRFINVLGDWNVLGMETGNGLAQEGAFENADFPRVVLKGLTFGDLDLSVRCRLDGGNIDQACGLMFHLQDSDNYFVTRANALEDNVRLYRLVAGDRQQFASANIAIDAGIWHELAVAVRGDEIAVSWNGQDLIRERDGTFGPGKIGLWTKADSITVYDDLTATAR